MSRPEPTQPSPSSGTALPRRTFLASCAASALVAGCRTVPSGHAHSTASELPLVVSTWPFGKAANEKALAVLQSGGGLLDAIVDGITVTENDLSVPSVGAGGAPDAEGVISLDACIMDGPTHKCGSVASVVGILPVIRLARTVMDRTQHVLLVGDGARRFALANGFQHTPMLTDGQRDAWLKWKAQNAPAGAAPPDSHDTIALVTLGRDGNLAGGCSTSGRAYKLPGRVGDSPIIGSGLYVDNDVGAAGATGVGENIMRFCGSFQVVECMRAGAHPEEACIEVIRRIQRKHPPGTRLDINFLAIDKRGRFGAAGTGDGFPFSVTYPGSSGVIQSAKVPNRV